MYLLGPQLEKGCQEVQTRGGKQPPAGGSMRPSQTSGPQVGYLPWCLRHRGSGEEEAAHLNHDSMPAAQLTLETCCLALVSLCPGSPPRAGQPEEGLNLLEFEGMTCVWPDPTLDTDPLCSVPPIVECPCFWDQLPGAVRMPKAWGSSRGLILFGSGSRSTGSLGCMVGKGEGRKGQREEEAGERWRGEGKGRDVIAVMRKNDKIQTRVQQKNSDVARVLSVQRKGVTRSRH